jgi:hypothetical protein
MTKVYPDREEGMTFPLKARVEVSVMVGDVPEAKDSAGLIDYNVQIMLAAAPRGA